MTANVSTAAPAVAPRRAPTTTMAGRVRRRLSTRTATLVTILIALVWTMPTIGLLLSSFRPREAINDTGWWTFLGDPDLTLDNYQDVLVNGRLGSYFLNSVVITIPSVLFSVGLAAFAAYALSWLNFRGRDWIFLGIFALQIVPLQMALVPLLRFFNTGVSIGGFVTIELPWGDLPWDPSGRAPNYTPIWFAHTCFGLALATFLLHNFMSELPKDLIEAAKVDGASHAKIFRRIVLPLVVPALASLAIFQFLWIWNDLLVALTFSTGDESTAPLTQRLSELAGTRGGEWQRLTAGAFVSMVIPLIVFLSLQRYFVRGLLAGSVKG
jgi:alpha-glucoside transport system permease protein